MNRYLISEPWRVVERGFDPANMRSSESIFSLGNGRFGQRANFEEGYSGDSMLGSYVGGVYYPDRTKVGWWKNGYPEYFAKVLNATNWTSIGIQVNGVVLDLASAHGVSEFERVLDMRRGLLQRRVEVETEAGVKVLLETERFISMAHPNRAAVKMTLTPLAGVESLTLEPKLDGGITNEDSNWDDAFWRHDGHSAEATDGTSVLTNTTEKTGFTVSVAQAMECEGALWESLPETKLVGLRCAFDASKPVELVKHVGLVSSLHLEARSVL